MRSPKKERVERRPEVSNSHKSDLFIYKLIDFLLSPPQHDIHKYWLSLNQEVTKINMGSNNFKFPKVLHWLLKHFNFPLLKRTNAFF